MKENSFDFLRLLFAYFVIITHSYPLSGLAEQDILSHITNNQTALSHIGVSGFFIISGFMIYPSLIRSKTILEYVFKRIIRIYPAYLILITLTLLIFGPMLTSLNYFDFIKNPITINYFKLNVNLLSPIQFILPDVFTDNPYPNAVNGSLWTIPYEFLFYFLIIPIQYVPKQYRRYLLIATFLLLIILFKVNSHFQLDVIPGTSFEKIYLLKFGLLFISGAIISELGFIKIKNSIIAAVSTLLLIISFTTNTYEYAQFFILPILIISIGQLKIPYLSKINKIGDYSYGIYLYGFLIQQTLQHYFELSLYEFIIYSVIFSTIFGSASWFLIEKNALKLKALFSKN